jgi:two-component system KDP operon response regulator KdpE
MDPTDPVDQRDEHDQYDERVADRTSDEHDQSAPADEGRVLVVEDDPQIREVVRMLLEEEGYEVIEAPDGAAGLTLLARTQGSLVALVDYRMPRMDGFTMLREIAKDGTLLKRHAYVLVTANRDLISPKFEELLTVLAIPIVTKPFDIDSLLSAVAEARNSLAAGDEQPPSNS